MKKVLIALLLIVACSVSSCSEMMIGDARVYGRVGDVSRADIEAAIAADRAAFRQGGFTVYEIQIANHDEIRIFHERRTNAKASYSVVRRVRGKWRFVYAPVTVG